MWYDVLIYAYNIYELENSRGTFLQQYLFQISKITLIKVTSGHGLVASIVDCHAGDLGSNLREVKRYFFFFLLCPFTALQVFLSIS